MGMPLEGGKSIAAALTEGLGTVGKGASDLAHKVPGTIAARGAEATKATVTTTDIIAARGASATIRTAQGSVSETHVIAARTTHTTVTTEAGSVIAARDAASGGRAASRSESAGPYDPRKTYAAPAGTKTGAELNAEVAAARAKDGPDAQVYFANTDAKQQPGSDVGPAVWQATRALLGRGRRAGSDSGRNVASTTSHGNGGSGPESANTTGQPPQSQSPEAPVGTGSGRRRRAADGAAAASNKTDQNGSEPVNEDQGQSGADGSSPDGSGGGPADGGAGRNGNGSGEEDSSGSQPPIVEVTGDGKGGTTVTVDGQVQKGDVHVNTPRGSVHVEQRGGHVRDITITGQAGGDPGPRPEDGGVGPEPGGAPGGSTVVLGPDVTIGQINVNGRRVAGGTGEEDSGPRMTAAERVLADHPGARIENGRFIPPGEDASQPTDTSGTDQTPASGQDGAGSSGPSVSMGLGEAIEGPDGFADSPFGNSGRGSGGASGTGEAGGNGEGDGTNATRYQGTDGRGNSFDVTVGDGGGSAVAIGDGVSADNGVTVGDGSIPGKRVKIGKDGNKKGKGGKGKKSRDGGASGTEGMGDITGEAIALGKGARAQAGDAVADAGDAGFAYARRGDPGDGTAEAPAGDRPDPSSGPGDGATGDESGSRGDSGGSTGGPEQAANGNAGTPPDKPIVSENDAGQARNWVTEKAPARPSGNHYGNDLVGPDGLAFHELGQPNVLGYTAGSQGTVALGDTVRYAHGGEAVTGATADRMRDYADRALTAINATGEQGSAGALTADQTAVYGGGILEWNTTRPLADRRASNPDVPKYLQALSEQVGPQEGITVVQRVGLTQEGELINGTFDTLHRTADGEVVQVRSTLTRDGRMDSTAINPDVMKQSGLDKYIWVDQDGNLMVKGRDGIQKVGDGYATRLDGVSPGDETVVSAATAPDPAAEAAGWLPVNDRPVSLDSARETLFGNDQPVQPDGFPGESAGIPSEAPAGTADKATGVDPDVLKAAEAGAAESSVPGLDQLLKTAREARTPDANGVQPQPDEAFAEPYPKPSAHSSTTAGSQESEQPHLNPEDYRTYPGQRNFYKDLGVRKDATPDQIKKAYRRLARETHPDAKPGDHKAEARFRELSEAYDVLSDPNTRKDYDVSQTVLGRMGFRRTDGGRRTRTYAPDFDSDQFRRDHPGGMTGTPDEDDLLGGKNPYDNPQGRPTEKRTGYDYIQARFFGDTFQHATDAAAAAAPHPDPKIFGVDPSQYEVRVDARNLFEGMQRTIWLQFIEKMPDGTVNPDPAANKHLTITATQTNHLIIQTSEGFYEVKGSDPFNRLREQIRRSAVGREGVPALQLVRKAMGLDNAGDGPGARGTLFDTTPPPNTTSGKGSNNGNSGLTAEQIAAMFRNLNGSSSDYNDGTSGGGWGEPTDTKYASGRYRWFYDMQDQTTALNNKKSGIPVAGPTMSLNGHGPRGNEDHEMQKRFVEARRLAAMAARDVRTRGVREYDELFERRRAAHERQRLLEGDGSVGGRVIYDKRFGFGKGEWRGNAHHRYSPEQLATAVRWMDAHKTTAEQEKSVSPFLEAHRQVKDIRQARKNLKEEIEDLEKRKKKSGKEKKRLKAARKERRRLGSSLRNARIERSMHGSKLGRAATALELAKDFWDAVK